MYATASGNFCNDGQINCESLWEKNKLPAIVYFLNLLSISYTSCGARAY